VHAKLWVDNSELVHAHFACANGMSEARRAKPGKFPDLLGGRPGAGHDFDLAHTIKGTLISKFTRGFDGAHDDRKILIRAEIVAIDHGGILKIVARQIDGASARWLHKSRRYRKRVFGRRTKSRCGFGCNDRQLFEDKINVGIARWTTRQVSLCLDGIAVDRPIRHLAFVLKHDAGHEHMVLQISANAGQVPDDIDSKAAKRLCLPDA
jgi:hypothetical protein